MAKPEKPDRALRRTFSEASLLFWYDFAHGPYHNVNRCPKPVEYNGMKNRAFRISPCKNTSWCYQIS